MGTFWVKLGYQRDLSLAQKLVIELISLKVFSVGELASILGMRKNHFKNRVLKGLNEYLKIDKKGFVNPRKNMEKVLEKNFDKKRLEDVSTYIKEERDNYSNKFLFEPLMRMLEKLGDKKLASRAKAKS